MSQELYYDLPEDPEEAFLVLEHRFREDRDRKSGEFDPEEYFPVNHYLEYMHRVSSSARELDLYFQGGLTVPAVADLDWSSYRYFQSELDQLVTSLNIRRARRDSRYIVRFDQKTKDVISHHITQIREIFQKLEIEDWKREALFDRLNDLQAEVDKDRFRYQVWAAFTIEAAGVLGKAAQELEPVRKFMETISSLVWGTKQAQQTKSLPPPTAPKQIPPPQKKPSTRKSSSKAKRNDKDDEIPF